MPLPICGENGPEVAAELCCCWPGYATAPMRSLLCEGTAAAAAAGEGRSGWGGGRGKPVGADRGLEGKGAGEPCLGVLIFQRLDLDVVPGLEWGLVL